MLLYTSFIAFVLLVSTNAQMQRQCTCGEFNPCFASASNVAEACADRCQSHVAATGASYPAVRQCIMAQAGRIRQVISCSRASFGAVCAPGPGHTVPKRYPETTQIAAMRQIQGMLAQSGLLGEASALIQAGKSTFGCMAKCAQSNSCVKQLGCGLALPSDNVMISNVLRCAHQAGFTTPVVRQICSCLANAGIRGLAPMCPRIVLNF